MALAACCFKKCEINLATDSPNFIIFLSNVLTGVTHQITKARDQWNLTCIFVCGHVVTKPSVHIHAKITNNQQ